MTGPHHSLWELGQIVTATTKFLHSLVKCKGFWSFPQMVLSVDDQERRVSIPERWIINTLSSSSVHLRSSSSTTMENLLFLSWVWWLVRRESSVQGQDSSSRLSPSFPDILHLSLSYTQQDGSNSGINLKFFLLIIYIYLFLKSLILRSQQMATNIIKQYFLFTVCNLFIL